MMLTRMLALVVLLAVTPSYATLCSTGKCFDPVAHSCKPCVTIVVPPPPLPPPMSSSPPGGGAKGGPYRWSFGDVGERWSSEGQEMMWNHQTGGKLNQSGCWAMAQFLRNVVEPSVIAAAREIPSCAETYRGMMDLPDTTTSKFFYGYVSRAIVSGQPYNCHGNYEWDLTQNDLIEPLCGHGNGRQQGCLYHKTTPTENAGWLAAHPDFGPLCDLRVANGVILEGDKSYVPHPHCAWYDVLCKYSSAHLQDGALDPHPAQSDVPFSPAECAALHAAHQAHNVTHVNTQGLQLEFERVACAASARHCTLATMLFVGPTNPLQSPVDSGRYQAEVDAAHTEWESAFNCGEGKPADLVGVVLFMFKHVRPHNLRFEPPGLRLREICSGAFTNPGTDNCLRTSN